MRRRQPLKSNKLKKWLAAPYAVWAAGFIIIPLILILYYAFTGEEGGFTLRISPTLRRRKHQGTRPGAVAVAS